MNPVPKDPHRVTLANELRLEVDKIRYLWSPPQHLTNESLTKIIALLRGEYVYFAKDSDN